jgi:hypothetical protein
MRHKPDDPHSNLLREINSQELTFDGADLRKRITRVLSSFDEKGGGANRTERKKKVRKLAALKRTLKVHEVALRSGIFISAIVQTDVYRLW